MNAGVVWCPCDRTLIVQLRRRRHRTATADASRCGLPEARSSCPSRSPRSQSPCGISQRATTAPPRRSAIGCCPATGTPPPHRRAPARPATAAEDHRARRGRHAALITLAEQLQRRSSPNDSACTTPAPPNGPAPPEQPTPFTWLHAGARVPFLRRVSMDWTSIGRPRPEVPLPPSGQAAGLTAATGAARVRVCALYAGCS